VECLPPQTRLVTWAIVLIVSLGFPNTSSSDAITLLQASAPRDSGHTERAVLAATFTDQSFYGDAN
jgi:hypothetical protein